MPYASIALVVLAAFIHATWNLMSKRAASAGPTFVFAYNIIACVAYAPWVVWVIAQGQFTWGWQAAGCLVASSVLHLAYSLCLQRGYQVADLSVVYPVARGTGPVLSSICAFILFAETPTGLGLAGLFGVIIGIALIATQGDLSAFKRPEGQRGVFWGSATGGLIASYTVVDAYAVKMLGVSPVVLDWISNLLRFVMLAPIVARNPGRALELMRGKWWLAVGVGLLSPLSYIFVLLALEMGAAVSVVAPAREMSMMIGALFGMIILRERVGPWRLIGCAVLIGGVIALGASK